MYNGIYASVVYYDILDFNGICAQFDCTVECDVIPAQGLIDQTSRSGKVGVCVYVCGLLYF